MGTNRSYVRLLQYINTKPDYVHLTLRKKKCYQCLLGFNDVYAAFVGRPLFHRFINDFFIRLKAVSGFSLRPKPIRKLHKENIMSFLIELEGIFIVFRMIVIEGSVALLGPYQKES